MSKRNLVLVVFLVLALPAGVWARRRRSEPKPADGPSRQEILDEWVLQGDESDAIIEPGFIEGGEDDAVVLEGIKEGGEMMAVFENELPKGAKVLEPDDVIAPDGERPGKRVVPGVDRFVPGGEEPGEYDGTKDTDVEIWRMQGFLAEGGKKFRFIGDRVFEAKVEVIRHKEPRWNWGSHTTEDVAHTKKWRKVRVGEKVIKRRTGKKLTRKKVGYKIIRKMKKDTDDREPQMTAVRCPVYKRMLAPEYQQYNVPVYRWEEVTVGTYKRHSFLTWIRRYRWVKRTYIVWSYWGAWNDFAAKYPTYVKAAEKARAVTERVIRERRQLMSSFRWPTFDEYLQDKQPADSTLQDEFHMNEKSKSTKDDTKEFVEHGVPDNELVTVPPPPKKR